MAKVETNTRRIVTRLLAEGWYRTGGSRHQTFAHADRPQTFVVLSRQKEQSIGVARHAAKAAGWI
jgi:hypothetical protein